ncbi:MAG: helix-turn-helix domain-containing protein [Planctomycetaceae bacterium]|jgi:excisionase family DNA binding protein|nr:helix-turn-helix domain-containing protein [Planctomycetaceae bacterium]
MTDTSFDFERLIVQLATRIADDVASRLAEQNRRQLAVDALIDEPTMAKRLNVSVQTLQRKRKAGEVPFVQMGSRILYRPAHVLDALCTTQEGDQ